MTVRLRHRQPVEVRQPFVYNSRMAELGAAPTYTDTAGSVCGADGVFGTVKTLGTGSLATGQVAVSTSATLIVAARANRASVTITSKADVAFCVGGSGVSMSSGLYVAGVSGASVTLETSAAVYAVGEASVTLAYVEAH